MKCAYCGDEINPNESYYEIVPLVDVYLHTDCKVGKLITTHGSTSETMEFRIKLH